MNKIKASLYVLFCILSVCLCSCGDDALFNKEDLASIKTYIYVVSDRSSGEPYERTSYSKNIYVSTNETIKFWSVYAVNGTFIATEDAEEYVQERSWDIDGQYYNFAYVRYAYSSPGKKNVILTSTDFLNDSVSDTISVYVNTPVSIELNQPENGYNQVDPESKDGIKFTWDIEGIDEWETGVCYVYVSLSENDVWDNPLGYTQCDDYPQIEGPLFPDIPMDSSVTVYWGVIVSNYTEDGLIERDTSKIFHFSTTFPGTKLAKVSIPLYYVDAYDLGDLHTKITVIDEFGNAIDTFYNTSADTTFVYWTESKEQLTFVIEEEKYKEYNGESISLSVPASTEINTEPIVFTDQTAPQIGLVNNSFASSDSIRFVVMDNGSGINKKTMSVVVARDSLKYAYHDNVIAFKNNCPFTCYASIGVQDNAQNTSPVVYWKIDPQLDSVYVSGPYLKEGRNE